MGDAPPEDLRNGRNGCGFPGAGVEQRIHPGGAAVDQRRADTWMVEPARSACAGAQIVPADVARAVEVIMSRDYILHKVRTALGRSVDQPPPPAPPVRISVPTGSLEMKIASF